MRIFSLRTSGPTTAGFQAFAMTSTQQPSNVWRTGDEAFKLYMTRKTQGWFQASSTGVALALPARPPPPPPTPPPAAIRGPGVGHTPSKTSRLQSAAFRSSPLPSSTPRLCQAPLACAIGYTHIEIICLQNCVDVGIDCDIIGEIMDVIIYDIRDL